jgi:predicted signal transduction protein with EAL and GGDEF domain
LLPQISRKEELNELAEKIMDIFRLPVFVKEQEFRITASGGISVYPGDGESANALIKHADLAMYIAKNMGKGRVIFCTDAMKQEVLEKMTLTNSLYRALERSELFLQYQPQVSVKTHEIMGFEALVGWNHPELGFVSPEVFIPLAEQTGLINSIGEWVLLNACAQSKA